MTAEPGRRVLLVDKPAGITSHDVVAGCAASAAQGGPRGHARSVRDRAAARPPRAQATRCQRFFMALPKTYRADGAARLALDAPAIPTAS